jgi:hypothetical protein
LKLNLFAAISIFAIMTLAEHLCYPSSYPRTWSTSQIPSTWMK